MPTLSEIEFEFLDHQLVVLSDSGTLLGWQLYHPRRTVRVEVVFTPASCYLSMGRKNPRPVWHGPISMMDFLNANRKDLAAAFLSDFDTPEAGDSMLLAIHAIRNVLRDKLKEVYELPGLARKPGAHITRIVP